MANQFCPRCGQESWGRVHNCKPVSRGSGESRTATKVTDGGTPHLTGALMPEGNTGKVHAGVATGPRESNTYKYRDPIIRRAQVAQAMRKYRARKHGLRQTDQNANQA